MGGSYRPPTTRLQIGDVIPLAPGEIINRTAIGYAKARKTRAATLLAKSEGRAARNENEARARKIAEGQAEYARRSADPFEQARAFLQRKGYVVYSAKVVSARSKGYVVGRLILADEKAVMTHATSLGFVMPPKAK